MWSFSKILFYNKEQTFKDKILYMYSIIFVNSGTSNLKYHKIKLIHISESVLLLSKKKVVSKLCFLLVLSVKYHTTEFGFILLVEKEESAYFVSYRLKKKCPLAWLEFDLMLEILKDVMSIYIKDYHSKLQ